MVITNTMNYVAALYSKNYLISSCNNMLGISILEKKI